MITDKLYPVSFDGIEFLVTAESVNRGKKVVVHEYPNSDVRYVEELGKLPPTFSITGLIHGADAITRRYQLENALERPGIKSFIHPIYGYLDVIALDFTVDSDQTNIGQFVFSIRLSQSRENITPAPEIPTATEVSSRADAARQAIDNALEKNYSIPSNRYNFSSIIDTTTGILDEVNQKINIVVDLSASGASKFNKVYRSITNKISTVVSSAQEIRENLTDFYAAALDAPAFIEQLGSAFDNLLDYPLTVATSSPLTFYQAERQQNEIAVTEHMLLTSLTGNYEAKAHTDYTTDTQLESARKLLDTKYRSFLTESNQDIMDIGLQSLANDNDVRTAMADLRVVARKVFDEKEKAVFRIVDISPGLTSMALTTFRYYGDLTYIDKMVDLNPVVNQANFNELIKALTG